MAVLNLFAAPAEAPENAIVACHWSPLGGAIDMGPMGQGAPGGNGAIGFALTEEALADAGHRVDVDMPNGAALLRLDEVAFPQGAVAYRHIHPGPGIRVLVEGSLRLIADDHTFDVEVGGAWVEGANSPVRAENIAEGRSRFVRAMILPVALEGKPSIDILDPADREKPRLQVTHRHVDHIFTA